MSRIVAVLAAVYLSADPAIVPGEMPVGTPAIGPLSVWIEDRGAEATGAFCDALTMIPRTRAG